MLQRIKTERCVCESILRKLIVLTRLRRWQSQTRGRGSCYGVRRVYILHVVPMKETCEAREGGNNKRSTTPQLTRFILMFFSPIQNVIANIVCNSSSDLPRLLPCFDTSKAADTALENILTSTDAMKHGGHSCTILGRPFLGKRGDFIFRLFWGVHP